MDALEAGICSRNRSVTHHEPCSCWLFFSLSQQQTKTDAVHYPFTGPVFGLAIAPDGSLLATDAGAGIFEIRRDGFSQVAQLPGVTAVSPIGRGDMFAITSRDFGGEGNLYRVSRGSTREIADLLAFELRVNPDGNPVAPPPAAGPSNPFDVEALSGGHVLVADAAGNSLLIVDQKGDVDWIATLPNEVVSTANAKAIFGCPGSNAPQCNLPAQIPAQPVATSVAVGPDGAYYVGELKGFPAPKSESRIWRIEPRPVTRCAARVRRAGSSRTDSPQSSIWSSVRMAHSMSSNWTRRAGWPCRTGRERAGRSTRATRAAGSAHKSRPVSRC